MRLKQAYDSFDEASVETALSMINQETGEYDHGYTQQEFAVDADINEIVRRFGLTGRLPDNVAVPQSGDFVGVTDFASAMLAVRKAQEDFMELPAELRYRFANDPQRLLEFMEDGSNFDEAVKLGLVQAKPVVGGTPDAPKAESPVAP